MSPTALITSVLIVEDQHLVRAGMKALIKLTLPQCNIFEAATHDQAVQHLLQQKFDVVFLDIDLRGAKSGMEVLQFARDRELEARFIMLSASDDLGTVLGCISAGASGYIAKADGDEGTFAQALDTVFSNRVFLPATAVNRSSNNSWGYNSAPASGAELGLPKRLRETLYYLCQGLPNKTIAKHMNLSENTVRKSHVSELLRYFNVTSRTELVVEIARRGIQVQPPASLRD